MTKRLTMKTVDKFVNSLDGITKFYIEGDRKIIYWKRQEGLYRTDWADADDQAMYKQIIHLRKKLAKVKRG